MASTGHSSSQTLGRLADGALGLPGDQGVLPAAAGERAHLAVAAQQLVPAAGPAALRRHAAMHRPTGFARRADG